MAGSISQSEAARRAGVSRAAIQKHLASGRIVSDGNKVDLASFEVWMACRTDLQPGVQPATPPVAVPVAAYGQPSEAPEAAAARLINENGAPYQTPEAIRIKENYNALLKQLEYDLKSGKVVEAALVTKAVGEEYARVRTRLLAIPAEQAPALHRCKTVAELQDRLLTLITRVLEELTSDGDPDPGRS
ncbi:hypothetical protein JUN65_08170 [Gluconacetobacter azotocaptans]|uniref:hypothetical protein n=1 Tax=Gluconacetobacter azotocaptans TaxID=142834 RepID=UPI001956FE76|nr:hypothetical protein [Gluconacetobacter azotocaptans]MBM9401560.1 hypothetical protein [Gluconacetobacter azotocaptans]